MIIDAAIIIIEMFSDCCFEGDPKYIPQEEVNSCVSFSGWLLQ